MGGKEKKKNQENKKLTCCFQFCCLVSLQLKAQNITKSCQFNKGQCGDLLHVLSRQISNPGHSQSAFVDFKFLKENTHTQKVQYEQLY